MTFGRGTLTLCTIITLSIALSAEACTTCLDEGSIEMNEQCKVCTGRGKVIKIKLVPCGPCSGTGKQWSNRSYTRTGNQGPRFCTPCGGTGSQKQKNEYTCSMCPGNGRITTRIICPSCRGSSSNAGGGARQSNIPTAAPAESTIQIEACTLCGPDGKVTRPVEIGCKLCVDGFSHKRESTDGKDIYKCRKCGKVCADRFAPCECGKLDCPDCGKIEKLTETVTCPLCGGDGRVTPLKRARMNQATQPSATDAGAKK